MAADEVTTQKVPGVFTQVAVLARILICAALFTAPVSLRGQEIFFGPTLGFTLSSFGGAAGVQTESHLGAQVGVYLDVGVNDWFSLRPELHYTEKGIHEDESDFIEIPLLASISVPVTGPVSGRLAAGPAFALPLKRPDGIVFSVRRSEGDPCTLFPCTPLEGIPDPNTDFGFVFGGGMDLRIGDRLLFADARYTVGFRDIHTASVFKNRSVAVSLGLGFLIGG